MRPIRCDWKHVELVAMSFGPRVFCFAEVLNPLATPGCLEMTELQDEYRRMRSISRPSNVSKAE
jgi:hypothetical protein